MRVGVRVWGCEGVCVVCVCVCVWEQKLVRTS